LIERAFVTIAEGQVHYRTAGRRDGRPAVFLLHASPSSSQSLEPLIAALGDRFFVVAPDTLGNGQSPAPAVAAPDVPYYADALDRVAEALGVQSLSVYGTHTGAHIAIEWAIRNPGRVQRLILEGLAHFDDALRREFQARYAPPRSPDASGSQFPWAWQFIRDQMIFFPYYKQDAAHLRTGGTFDPVVLHNLVMDVLNSLETYHLAYQAVFQHDLESRLPLIAVLTLCLGNPDEHLDEGMSLALEKIPEVRRRDVGPDATRSQEIGTFLLP
jgi:pimeloyl-ACP methyl ester carboxylesterase